MEGTDASKTMTEEQEDPESYRIKWISWKDNQVPIFTQNANGPCPLISMMNVLLLRGGLEKARKSGLYGSEEVQGSVLLEYLGNAILHSVPDSLSADERLNYEANISDAIGILPRLESGLDVNVKFNGVRNFEYTKEILLFDLLNISLYHGWLVDPQSEAKTAVGDLSYNSLVEKIISDKSSPARDFLEFSASQLTYHGLCELTSALEDGELAVFFRNNHFSTITKTRERLYLLVTDQGFLKETGVVWETLDSVDGDVEFVDECFNIVPPKSELAAISNPDVPLTREQQIDQDLLLAMTLQEEDKSEYQEWNGQIGDTEGLSDKEIAMKLQKEEIAASQRQEENRTPQDSTPEEPSPSRQLRTSRSGFISTAKKNCVIS